MSKKITSTSPKKELWKVVAGIGAVSEALESLELIKETKKHEIKHLSRQLWCSFFVCYTRPFTNNNDIGILKTKILPTGIRDFHQTIIKMRNASYGHIDPTKRTDQGLQLNQIKITVTETEVIPRPQGIEPHIGELSKFYNHTLEVYKALSDYSATLYNKCDFPEFNQPGDYIFDYTKQ